MNSLTLFLNQFNTQFHFLRPHWLWAIISVVLLVTLLWRQKHQAQQWQQLIAPELLTFLIDGKTTRIKPWQLFGLLLAWIITCVALAGPSWQKRPMPVEQNQQALVILLDLSPSMLSEDIKPSRLIRARLKITDILRARKDGQTALIAYAGEAHVVTPLTDDVETINNIVPALHPNVMPLPGSNTEAAIVRAFQLMKDAGLDQGDILLITDDVAPEAQDSIRQYFKKSSQYRLSILGVGGSSPAPIPSGRGGFIRNDQKNIVTTYLDSSSLKALASDSGGRYASLANTDQDIDYLMKLPEPQKADTARIEREFDNWYDQGHWLVLLLLPIVLYCFRRGVFVLLICIPLSALVPQKTYAFTWDDLWKNKNQQALEQFKQEHHSEAAEEFTDSNWKASANFRAGNYAEAAKEYAQKDDALAHYNRGNALAKAGTLDEAVKAYDEALKRDPSLIDAEKNRAILEKAIKEQKQNQQNNDQNKDQKDQKNKDQQNDKKPQGDNKNDDQEQSEQKQNDSQKNDQQQSSDQKQQESDDKNSDVNNNQQSSSESKDQKSQDQKEKEQKAAEEKAKEDEKKKAAQKAQEEEAKEGENKEALQAAEPKDDMTEEQRQAMEQWLRRVPDDPGGLLRNKFKYQYYKNRQEMHNGDWQPPENDAIHRW